MIFFGEVHGTLPKSIQIYQNHIVIINQDLYINNINIWALSLEVCSHARCSSNQKAFSASGFGAAFEARASGTFASA